MAFGAPLRFGPAGSTTGTNFANLDGSLQTKLKDKSVFDSWTDGGALASVLAGHPNFCWDNPATAKWIHGTCEVIHGTTAAYRQIVRGVSTEIKISLTNLRTSTATFNAVRLTVAPHRTTLSGLSVS